MYVTVRKQPSCVCVCVCYISAGWCNTLSECADWTKHSLGSSATWGEPGTGPGKGTSWGESAQAKRCEDEDDNCVYLKYCDGGSFSGFRAGTVPSPAPDGKSGKIPLHFRGLRNFDATVEWALAHGMNRATEVVLTGISAGGVAVFVHVDRLAARVSTTCRWDALPVFTLFCTPYEACVAQLSSWNFARMLDL